MAGKKRRKGEKPIRMLQKMAEAENKNAVGSEVETGNAKGRRDNSASTVNYSGMKHEGSCKGGSPRRPFESLRGWKTSQKLTY